MSTETKIRKQILKRIERIPEEHLAKIDNYLKKLETKSTKRDKILAYSGTWNDLDESVFSEFTDALSKRRQENKRRSHETSID